MPVNALEHTAAVVSLTDDEFNTVFQKWHMTEFPTNWYIPFAIRYNIDIMISET